MYGASSYSAFLFCFVSFPSGFALFVEPDNKSACLLHSKQISIFRAIAYLDRVLFPKKLKNPGSDPAGE